MSTKASNFVVTAGPSDSGSIQDDPTRARGWAREWRGRRAGRSRARFLISVSACSGLLLTIIAVGPWFGCGQAGTPSRGKDKPVATRPAEGRESEARGLWEQASADERRLTIRQVSSFHFRFIVRCMGDMPRNVFLQYQGILGTDKGQPVGRRMISPDDRLGAPLEWGLFVEGGAGIFSFAITTRPTKQTVVKCDIEGQVIYVNETGVAGDRGVDGKLPELGGRTVREVLSLLNRKDRS